MPSAQSSDLYWFKTAATVHFNQTLSAGEVIVHDVTATSRAALKTPLPTDAHKQLKGTIEHINVYSVVTAFPSPIDVVFFSGQYDATTTTDGSNMLDHESFPKADFLVLDSGHPAVASHGGLQIPYVDTESTGKFHIGVVNSGATAITDATNLVIAWAWRPDLGR